MIKIKLRENKKAIVKFTHPMDEQFFIFYNRKIRDDGQNHPKISIKNKDGKEVPEEKPNIVQDAKPKLGKGIGYIGSGPEIMEKHGHDPIG